MGHTLGAPIAAEVHLEVALKEQKRIHLIVLTTTMVVGSLMPFVLPKCIRVIPVTITGLSRGVSFVSHKYQYRGAALLNR